MALSEQALEAAYRRLEKPLYNYLFRWFWNSAECEDLIHDAFERIWKRRSTVDPQRVDALAWTIVINLARNRQRKLARWGWLPLPGLLQAKTGADEQARLDEQEQRLRRALDALPGEQRELILLEVFAGIGRNELATLLDIPKGTLASRKHAATNRLRALLEEDNEY